MGRDIAGVDLADAARAEKPHANHFFVLLPTVATPGFEAEHAPIDAARFQGLMHAVGNGRNLEV